jgi:hypothetical protein
MVVVAVSLELRGGGTIRYLHLLPKKSFKIDFLLGLSLGTWYLPNPVNLLNAGGLVRGCE